MEPGGRLQQALIPQRVYGFEVRQPYPGELAYFQANPGVAGMAADDDRIVLNPFSPLSAQEKQSVAQNEATRLYIRKNKLKLDFDVTPEQQQRFHGTPYGQPEHLDDLKSTLLGRFISGDPSAGQATPRQAEWIDYLRGMLQGR